MHRSKLAGILAAAAFAVACGTSINSDIRVADGEKRSGGLSTVNGNIVVGEQGRVGGSCKTVNGGIRLADGATVGGLASVNGSIRGGAGITVDGDVESVNGSVSLDVESRVDGQVYTINGGIELARTLVARNVRTVHGDIRLSEGATVKGDIVFEEKMGSSWSQREPLIVEIADGSVVEGDLIVEDRDLRVEVRLSGGGKILGRVENAEVVEDDTGETI